MADGPDSVSQNKCHHDELSGMVSKNGVHYTKLLLARPLLNSACMKLEIFVILYLTGLNYYGILKPFFHLISMCMCSQCDSTSLPIQRSQIKKKLFVF